MSFASECKTELSKLDPGRECCRLAELCGLYTVMGSLSLLGRGRVNVQFSGESIAVCRRVYTLLVRHFQFSLQIHYTDSPRFGGRRKCVITLGPLQSPRFLCALHMMEAKAGSYMLRSMSPKLPITRLCCSKAYLRGIFLGGGAISNPEKGYHLELSCRDEEARQAAARCMQKLGLPVHFSARRGRTYMYLKQCDQITELLAQMGASGAVMKLQDLQVRRQVYSQATRSMNCDGANLQKTVNAGEEQLSAIRRLQESGRLLSLPPALQEIAEKRLEAPEATLAQLGEMLDPPVSKSGVNHRMRRLMAVLKEEEKP